MTVVMDNYYNFRILNKLEPVSYLVLASTAKWSVS
jgi:hypothetical protein